MKNQGLVKVEVTPLSGEKYDLKGHEAYGVDISWDMEAVTTLWIKEGSGVKEETLAAQVRQELSEEVNQALLRTMSTVLQKWNS